MLWNLLRPQVTCLCPVTVTGGDVSETQGGVSVPVSNVSGGSDARVSANVTREPGVITRLGGFSRLGRVGV